MARKALALPPEGRRRRSSHEVERRVAGGAIVPETKLHKETGVCCDLDIR